MIVILISICETSDLRSVLVFVSEKTEYRDKWVMLGRHVLNHSYHPMTAGTEELSLQDNANPILAML